MNCCHAQLSHGHPESLRHCGVVCEWPEVAALNREVKEQAHHQRRTEAFLGRIDAAFHQERARHWQSNVEWRDEPQIKPVRTLKGDPLTERSADRVRRNKHPLRTRRVGNTQLLQLFNKWIHATTFTIRTRSTLRDRTRESRPLTRKGTDRSPRPISPPGAG